MSLAQKMKLQELTNQVEKLSVPRREVIAQQTKLAAEKVKNEVVSFFTSKNFDIQGNDPRLTASYHGGLHTVIDFSGLIGGSFGSDGFVSLKYNNKDFSISYLVNRGSLPNRGAFSGSPDGIQQQEIEFYESQLIPALEEIGVTDLTGDFSIHCTFGSGNQKQRKKYNSITEILDEMIC